MARLFTTGFEVGSPGTFSLLGEDASMAASGALTTGTLTIDTGTFRSGKRSLKAVTAAQGGIAWKFNLTATLSNTYFSRHCVLFPSSAGFPSAQALFNFLGDSTNAMLVGVTSAGNLTVWRQSVNTAIINGPPLALNTWYCVELAYTPNTGAATLYLNGTQIGSATGDVSASTTWLLDMGLGNAGAGNITGTVFIDDVALNDNTGGNQNSLCGQGQVAILLPSADSSHTGFTAGAGGTTSLFAAVDNTPPVGLATASATNTSQILDATGSTTGDNYQPTLQTYTAAGVPPSATIVLAQGICNHANSSITSRTNGIQVLSNPVITETTGATGTTAAATFPTGWNTLKTAINYSPTVTLSTAPIMEFRKATASTDGATADFMGLYVEYLRPIPMRSIRGVGT